MVWTTDNAAQPVCQLWTQKTVHIFAPWPPGPSINEHGHRKGTSVAIPLLTGKVQVKSSTIPTKQSVLKTKTHLESDNRHEEQGSPKDSYMYIAYSYVSVLNIWTKFHKNPSKNVGDMERTQTFLQCIFSNKSTIHVTALQGTFFQ